MKHLLVTTLAILAAAENRAIAGECSDGETPLAALEKYAKDRKTKPEPIQGLCMDQQILEQPALTKRFLAACEKVLAFDRTYGTCVRWTIDLGHKKLGATDLFETVEEAYLMDPLAWESPPALLYIKLDDPRAMPRFIAGWKAQAAKPPPKASWQLKPWIRFRRGAAKFFGKHGGATEKAFLEEQLAVTKDADVKRSIKDAIAAIDKRTTKTP